jgi:ATP-dependent helicase HrpB
MRLPRAALLPQYKLPIDDILPVLLETIREHPNVLLHAPPGAGKTTRVPLALLDISPPESGRIIMLEPRRLAAVSAARWMALTLDEEVGQTVGYSIRFDSRVTRFSRIEVVTEGILTRRIQNDPALEGVAMVIFDEFHERSIHADLGLALCRDVQQQVRPDLKLLIMSATLDINPLSGMLDDAPVISATGRSFPVEEIYLNDQTDGKLSQRMTSAVIRALNESEGDILAFLPGAGEIRSCAGLLADAGIARGNIEVHQLYGDLPFSQQQAAIEPSVCRKIVLATSIAETSLTIEGVRIVIDSGMSRRMRFDPAGGMNRLVTQRESRASAEQRKGRAGRLAPGVCYRLYSRHTLSAMTPHTPPEILEADLSPLLLELAVWGTKEPSELAWLNPPPETSVLVARELLIDLAALDSEGRVTALGRAMSRLPLHPRLSRMLIRSEETGCPRLACDLAALLSEKDIILRSAVGKYSDDGSHDISERIEVLNEWRESGSTAATVDISALKAVERSAAQLRRLSGASANYCGSAGTSRLLLVAYPDRVAKLRDSGGRRYLLANGRGACTPAASIRAEQLIIAVVVDGGGEGDGIIRHWMPVTEDLLREELGQRIELREVVGWDAREGRVTAAKEEYLGAVCLTSKPFVPDPETLLPVVMQAVRASELGLLSRNEAFLQLQARVMLLQRAFPGDSWPDFSDQALVSSLDAWLKPSLLGVRNSDQLAVVNCAAAAISLLDYRRRKALEVLAPTHLEVPSGSRIRLDYCGGELPVLAVKLQELFGLADTPTIAEGRVALLLHLLSPAGRPIQVTRDLKGFWNGAYHQVKKELKGRYPKHPWPDDPWSAVPTKRLKPRG